MSRAGIAALLLLLLGCEQRTRVNLVVPELALPSVARLEMRAYPLSQACADFRSWAASTCGSDCVPGEAETRLPSDDQMLGQSELTPTGDGGALVGSELPLGMDADSWTVFAIGYDAGGSSFLYGCSVVEAGADLDLPLFYPLCAGQAACSTQFHPECNPIPECEPDLTNPLDVVCRTNQAEASAFVDASGRSCRDPDIQPGRGICEIGLVACVRNDLGNVITPAVCPTYAEEPCAEEGGYQAARDFDCDGRHPFCGDDSMCTVPETRSCGGDRECGLQVCQDDGAWSECIFDREECNGEDDDCDGEADEASAIFACNASGNAEADSCVGGECLCSGEPACNVGLTCCRGQGCRNLRADRAHCGGCFRPCPGDQACIAGRCGMVDDAGIGTPDGGVVMVPDCVSPIDCATVPPRANGCTAGTCTCGGGPACERSEACCGNTCVDILTSTENCGGCGAPCRNCVGGRCQD